MQNILKQFVLGAALFAAGMLSSEETIADKSTGKTFPVNVSFSHGGKEWNLTATGVSTRTKFFVKVYSVASYIQDGADLNKNNVFNQALNDNLAKQLTLIWVRDVDSKTIKDGYQDTFKKVFSQTQQQALQSQEEQFLGFFNENASVNDKHVLRWIPGGTIEVEINGVKKGEVQSPEFARAVWGIWLGPKSVVNRAQLVSRVGG